MLNLQPINYDNNIKHFIPVTKDNKTTISKYFNAVNTLMRNDRNGSYDEILRDYSYNLMNAYNCLKEVLNRLVKDEGLEGEELQFYQEVENGL